MTLNVIVAVQPEPVAVMVTLPPVSSAVNVVVAPELGLTLPAPAVIVQVALPSE